MPEGDTIHRAAEVLARHLVGQKLTGFSSRIPALASRAAGAGLVGRRIEAVEAHGKHLLLRFEGGWVLHTHMRMLGSWHVYRAGAAWSRPANQARVVLRTASMEAPCFNAPVVELLSDREAARHPHLAGLGPDATRDDFDEGAALERLRGRPDRTLGEAILDQRVLAGVGNVIKSEALFLEGLDPFRRVAGTGESALRSLLARIHGLLVQNRRRTRRRTRRSLDPRQGLWVYRRAGRPCRRCGTAIASRQQGEPPRTTYFCPRCQPSGPAG